MKRTIYEVWAKTYSEESYMMKAVIIETETF